MNKPVPATVPRPITALASRRSGILLHVTSLPGPHGSGDFGPEAYHFVDWLAATGQRLWQWLPVTPIGAGNSPYQGVSAFAGNPWLVAFEPLIACGWLDAGAPDFDRQYVDFDRVLPWRESRLRLAADGFFRLASAAERAQFADWCAAEAAWLDDYTLFMALRSEQGGKPWWAWPDDLVQRQPAALARVRSALSAEVAFWSFVQWCFDRQLCQLKEYANARGVTLLGDVPIFVAHDSADCWARPQEFLLDPHYQPTVVAGVPPDAMAAAGQRWGNPLYRWEAMAANGFSWWIARLKRSFQTADVVRIDHFRGFAACFEIPAAAPDATQGVWVDAPGADLFEAITAALGALNIVAEDLGTITPDVVELRERLGLPGMRILQFAFSGDAGHEYLPHNYATNTVAYTGTHDNDTALGWWRSTTDRERCFAGGYLAATDQDVHWTMIRALSTSVAATVIFPLQDVLGLDGHHRMNVPGTPTGNWRWRFEWPMITDEATRILGLMTAASGRGAFGLLRLPH